MTNPIVDDERFKLPLTKDKIYNLNHIAELSIVCEIYDPPHIQKLVRNMVQLILKQHELLKRKELIIKLLKEYEKNNKR